MLGLYMLHALPKLSGNVIYFVFSKEQRNNEAERRKQKLMTNIMENSKGLVIGPLHVF